MISDLDVSQETGGVFRALVKEVNGIRADKNNKIIITMAKGKKGTPQICGFEILRQ